MASNPQEKGAAEVVEGSKSVDITATAGKLQEKLIPPTAKPISTHSDPDEDSFVEMSPDKRYGKSHDILGRGASKDVYRAYDLEEGIEVAWNEVSLTDLPKSVKESIINEVSILNSLSHPAILEVIDWWNIDGNRMVFITELMTSGTLRQFLLKSKQTKLRVVKKWCRTILEGLVYLHSRDPPIIHRDLKCDNIFINGHSGAIKIGDLGLATSKAQTYAVSVLGTPEFMAPELYDEHYNELVDVYAFGMCVMEMVTKEYPYAECANAAQIYRKGVQPSALTKIRNQKISTFISKCLQITLQCAVADRSTAQSLLNDDFLLPDEDFDNRPVNLSDQFGDPQAAEPANKRQHELKEVARQKKERDREERDRRDRPLKKEGEVLKEPTPKEQPKHRKATAKITCAKRPSEHELHLKMVVRIGEKRREVTFPYNLQEDKASAVVDEMVKEFRFKESTGDIILRSLLLFLDDVPPYERVAAQIPVKQTTPKPIATANMDNLPSTQTTPQPGLPPKSAAKKSQVPKAAGDTPKPVPTVSSQPPSQTHTPQSTHTPQEAAEADILKAELEALENQLLKDREDLHRQHQQKQQAIMEKHRARLSGQDSPPFINPPSSFPSTHNTPITSPDSHLPVPTPQFATASPFRKQQQPILSTPMAAPAPQAQSQVQAYAYPGYQGSSIAATPPIVPSSNSATIKPTPPAQATRTPLSAPLQSTQPAPLQLQSQVPTQTPQVPSPQKRPNLAPSPQNLPVSQPMTQPLQPTPMTQQMPTKTNGQPMTQPKPMGTTQIVQPKPGTIMASMPPLSQSKPGVGMGVHPLQSPHQGVSMHHPPQRPSSQARPSSQPSAYPQIQPTPNAARQNTAPSLKSLTKSTSGDKILQGDKNQVDPDGARMLLEFEQQMLDGLSSNSKNPTKAPTPTSTPAPAPYPTSLDQYRPTHGDPAPI